MNVLLYTDADVFAGTEKHMLDLATGLRGLGVHAPIACPRPAVLADRADEAGIPVMEIPKKGLIDRNAIAILSRRLRQGDIDLIHAHNGRTHIAAAAAVRDAGRGVCVTTQHFLSPARTTRRGPKAWVASYLHRRANASTAHTVAISDAVRAAALARHDTTPEKITTVRNGSAPPDVALAPDTAAMRKALGLEPHTPFIFCAARLQAEKDIPTLIKAMPGVMAACPAAQCLIAGEGDEQAALKAQIAALGLVESVKLLGFRKDIPALLRACDLFVLPAYAEPFGLVLLEAMALGVPVIATSAGGPPEIVEQGRTGLLVEPGDSGAMAGAITELLGDPDKQRAFGAAGRQRYLAHFTIERMAREMLALYARVMPATAGTTKGNA